MGLRPIVKLHVCECRHRLRLLCLIGSETELMGFGERWASRYVSLLGALIAPIVALLYQLVISLVIAVPSMHYGRLRRIRLKDIRRLCFKENWLKDLNWLFRLSSLKVVLDEVCLEKRSEFLFSIVYLKMRYLS